MKPWTESGELERQALDRSDKPTDRAQEESPRRPEDSFRKERVEKDDGRYIIFYSFDEDGEEA